MHSGYSISISISILQRDMVTPSLERWEVAWAALNDGLDIAWNVIVRPSERDDSEVNKMDSELGAWLQKAGKFGHS